MKQRPVVKDPIVMERLKQLLPEGLTKPLLSDLVTTPFGRKRKTSDDKPNTARYAINHWIQGNSIED